MWPLPSRVRLEMQSCNLHETYQLPCVQQITPDDGHRRCPKHVVLWQNKFRIFDASSWLFYTKLVTMHGHLNINLLHSHLIVAICSHMRALGRPHGSCHVSSRHAVWPACQAALRLHTPRCQVQLCYSTTSRHKQGRHLPFYDFPDYLYIVSRCLLQVGPCDRFLVSATWPDKATRTLSLKLTTWFGPECHNLLRR